jgi:PqqA peptide cyclase
VKPRLSAKARVVPDPRDGRPVLLSPERGLRLGDTAAAIVALCDGTRDVDTIVGELARRYSAPPDVVARDVGAMLADLHRRALLDGWAPSGGAAAGTVSVTSPSPLAGDDRPYTLVAELTHRCPLACPYCSNPRELVRGHAELTTAEWARVVDEAAALGVMQMHLTGGEPLARSDLEEIAAQARRRGL